MKTEWDLESATTTYNVDGWGEGYFAVNTSGNVEARPLKENGGSIDILAIVDEARARNLSFPLLIRFQDLLRHRVESINRAFQSAIFEFDYRIHYRGVFPIKSISCARSSRKLSTQANNFILDSKPAANRSWLLRSPCRKTLRA